MKTQFRFVLLGLLVAIQSHAADYFSPADKSILKGKPVGNMPKAFQLYEVDLAGLSKWLDHAPKENLKSPISNYGMKITLPVAGLGELSFKVADIPVMEGKAQEKHPEINTYTGQCVEKPSFTLKMDITPLGFHAAVFAEGEVYVIDPVELKSKVVMAYRFSDFSGSKDFKCLSLYEHQREKPSGTQEKALVTSLGTQRRDYRLAIGTNSNFVTFYGGTQSLALSAVTTKVNRMNGIYERDFAIRMNLVSNSLSLMGLFTQSDGGSVPSTHDAIVLAMGGAGNFDIGHYLGVRNLPTSATGFNGRADVGVVCNNASKGAGFSQADGGAINDPWIDFGLIPHEIGHMFGANHSFNSCCPDNDVCNRNESTAYEPGAGNSIMSYWFGCEHGENDGSLLSFFHSGSWLEVSSYTTTGSPGSTCPVLVNTGNAVPTANAGGNLYVPQSTPFALSGTSSDEAADLPNLTRSWDQIDAGPVTAPNSPVENAPLFRMREPSTSNERILPALSSILDGTSTIGETLPSYSRRFRMAFLVRDNRAGNGATRIDTASYYVVKAAGPFTITSPNAATVGGQGASFVVTWNVALTNVSPISTSSVAIDLSVNNGTSFTTLLASTPNDGSQSVTLPASSLTSTARIRVRAIGNVYFAMSPAFTIGYPGYGNVSSGNQTICNGGDPNNITLVTTGLPVGITYQWYFKDGLITAPLNADPVGTWSLIPGATVSSYNPPAGLTGNRSYACRVVSPSYPGGSGWVTGVRQVTVLPPVNFGTLASGNQTFSETGNPSLITFSTAPSGGNGTFAYRWYQADGLQPAPTGTTVPSNWTLISGAVSSSYDPPAVFKNTSYAVMVDPTGTQNCGGFTWATGVRQITITNGCTSTFCRPSMATAPFLYINSVSLGSATTTSANNNGYGFYSYTNYYTTGQTVLFTLQAAANTTLAPTTQAYYRIFANWNKNGVINEFSDLVYASLPVSPLSAVTGSFTIPASAVGGRTTIRVSMTTFSTTSACWSSTDLESGEVEDYCIYVSKGLTPGLISGAAQNLCNGAIPGSMSVTGFSPSTATFQWYYKDVIVSSPGASEGLDGFAWTLISGATSSTYTPTSTFTGSRTYACRVSANGTTLWASGVRQVTIKPAVNFGTLSAANQSSTGPIDPNPITFSTLPSGGSGTFTYQWYRASGVVAAPTGTTIPAGWTLLSGETASSYNPPLTESSLSFAVMVNPAGSPDCGVATWAAGVRHISVTPFSPGTLAPGNQTLCFGGNAGPLNFSVLPTAGSSFQWYSQNGIIAAPLPNDPITGWSVIPPATGSSFDPDFSAVTSITYACRVTNGTNSQWASGVVQVTVLPAFNPGSLIANQTLCSPYNPAPITMATNPQGSGKYQWTWYYVDNPTTTCPTVASATSGPAGWTTSITDYRYFGNSTTGDGIFFDPTSTGTSGRTWVLRIIPQANGAIPACGTPSYTNCHRTFKSTSCREAVADLPVAERGLEIGQNIPNPFTDETTIHYFIPAGDRNGLLEVLSLEGKVVYKEVLPEGVPGEVNIRKGTLAAGTYFYRLRTQGGLTQPQKMVVQ